MAEGEGAEPFNPQVQPTQDPNYAFWSRPSRPPMPDVSKETLFKGLGSALDQAASGADTFIKRGIIQPQVEQEAGAVRDQFVNSLNTARTQLAQNTTGTKQPSLTDESESSTTGLNIPGAVSQIGRNAQTLQGALDSGHISETYYYGQLNSLAKSLRAQYPGYRDYIDQELARVTGVHPANTYIRSLIGDINRQNAEKTSSQDKTMAALRSANEKGMPHANELMSAYSRGLVSEDYVNSAINKSFAFEYNLKYDDAQHKMAQNTREDDNRFYVDRSSKVADQMISTANEFQFTLAGHNPGTLLEMSQRKAGGEQFGDEDWQNLGQSELTLRTTMENQLYKYLATDAGDGMSYGDHMGMKPAEQAEWVKNKLAPIDANISAIKDKELGLLGAHAALNKAIIEDGKNKLLSDPDNAKLASAMDLIKTTGGENMMPMLSDQIVKNGTLGRVAGWLDEKQIKSVAQPDAARGQFTTLQGDITDGKNKKINEPKAYEGLLTNIKALNDPGVSTDAKAKLAHYYFDPKNFNLMPQFKEDTVDAQGNRIDGKYKAYTLLFNEATSKSMWSLSKKASDPNLWQNYENSARENAFRLFGDKIATLSDLQNDPIMTNAHFKYDSDRGLTLIDVNGQPMRGSVVARDAVSKINLMLNSLRAVEKPTGGDVDAFLLSSMQRLGLDPSKMEGLPARLAQAIIAAKPPKAPTESEALGSPYDPYGTKSKNKDTDRIQPGR